MNAFGELIARDAVRIERLLPGPIDRVWDYFVDADKRRLWIGGGVIEPFAGGRVEISVDNASLADKGDPPPPKYAAIASTMPLTHGSVSPAKNGFPP